MVAKFLDHNNGELKHWRRRRQRERQRSNRFRLAKQQLYTCNTLFVHSWPSLHECDRKLSNFTRPLYEVGEHSAKFPFFLFLPITVLLDSTPDQNIPDIWQIKWNSMRSMKFETAPIHFFKWCFRFVIIQEFCYHGNTSNGFSLLRLFETC